MITDTLKVGDKATMRSNGALWWVTTVARKWVTVTSHAAGTQHTLDREEFRAEFDAPGLEPYRLRMITSHAEELRECELGSHEDWEGLRAGDDDDKKEAADMIYGQRHRYDILGEALTAARGKKSIVVELRSLNEVAEIYYGACSGTFQIDRTDEGGDAKQYRYAIKICDELRPMLAMSDDPDHAELLRQWPRPAGC